MRLGLLMIYLWGIGVITRENGRGNGCDIDRGSLDRPKVKVNWDPKGLQYVSR